MPEGLGIEMVVEVSVKLVSVRLVSPIDEGVNPQEFSYEIELPESEIREAMTQPLESIMEEINRFFNSSSTKFTMEQYRLMQLDESYFEHLVEIIRGEVKSKIQYSCGNSAYLSKISDVVEKYLLDAENTK